MARIRCRACGKGYSYQGDCCPNCGAFNRRPQRGYIGADGDYHAVDDKVCFEQKVCYEEQAEKAWKASPDRKPERKKSSASAERTTAVKRPSAVKRPNTKKFGADDVNDTIDRFTRTAGEQAKKIAAQFLDDEDNSAAAEAVKGFAEKMRQSRAGGVRRGATRSKGNPLVVIIVIVVIFVINMVIRVVDDIDLTPQREPAYPDHYETISAEPAQEMYYNDYGSTFRLEDGTEFTAFTTDVHIGSLGGGTVSVYCDADAERFTPVLTDEWTGSSYTHNGITEWQENNYEVYFQVNDHDPNDYWYSFSYVDGDTGESYRIAEFGSDDAWFYGADGSRENEFMGVNFVEFMLSDGVMVNATIAGEYADGTLTMAVTHDDDAGRLWPYVWNGEYGNEEYYAPVESEESDGLYTYVFDVSYFNDGPVWFCYMDGNDEEIYPLVEFHPQ